ncbi:helix-turn-helix domain-containing protein [Actinoplanes sp. NPDC024001]|uniref:ArsR/SmtB family transcription factor n=1 Tax=Actinoplanes sp. NPDC024001 TaxID=3154598 RepID=UPI0033D838A9
MSLGEASPGATAELRALAHPVRLRIMSLLTASSLTAAEVARELGITHANASYHLRNLLSAGHIAVAGEEKIRGGTAKRYRHEAAAAVTRRGAGVRDEAELWIDPETWHEIRDRIAAALRDLHAAAQPPGSPGTVRTSTTVALFAMEP